MSTTQHCDDYHPHSHHEWYGPPYPVFRQPVGDDVIRDLHWCPGIRNSDSLGEALVRIESCQRDVEFAQARLDHYIDAARRIAVNNRISYDEAIEGDVAWPPASAGSVVVTFGTPVAEGTPTFPIQIHANGALNIDDEPV